MKLFTILFLIAIAIALVNAQRGFGRRGSRRFGGRSVGGLRRSVRFPRGGLPSVGRFQSSRASVGTGRRGCQSRPQRRPSPASPIAPPVPAAPVPAAPVPAAPAPAAPVPAAPATPT